MVLSSTGWLAKRRGNCTTTKVFPPRAQAPRSPIWGRLALMGLLVCWVGCSSSSPGTEDIPLEVRAPGQFLLGERLLDRKQLMDELRSRVARDGMSNRIVLRVPLDAGASNLLSGVEAASSCGFWRYQVAVGAEVNGLEFSTHPGDGPAGAVDLDVSFSLPPFARSRGGTVSGPLVEVLAQSTSSVCRVWLHAEDATPIAEVVEVLQTCSRKPGASAYFDPLAPRPPTQASPGVDAP